MRDILSLAAYAFCVGMFANTVYDEMPADDKDVRMMAAGVVGLAWPVSAPLALGIWVARRIQQVPSILDARRAKRNEALDVSIASEVGHVPENKREST